MESTGVMEQLLKGLAEEELTIMTAHTEAAEQLRAIMKQSPREGVEQFERLYRSVVRESLRVSETMPTDTSPVDALAALRRLGIILADIVIAQQLLVMYRRNEISYLPVVRHEVIRRQFKIGEFHPSITSTSSMGSK